MSGLRVDPGTAASGSDLRTRLRHGVLNRTRLGPAFVFASPRYRWLAVSPRTTIAIDGFPRSANSYAMYAFLLANPDRSALAGHTHSPQLLRQALGRGLPTMLLIREPGDSCASYAQYLRTTNVGLLLRLWFAFHVRLVEEVDRLLVADFDDVTADFGAVIAAANDRFGTDFVRYRPTAANEAAVQTSIDRPHQHSRRRQHGPHRVARPAGRGPRSAELLAGLDADGRRDLDRAVELYAAFRAPRPEPGRPS